MTGAPDRLLRRLEWRVIRRLEGRLQGAYRTAFRGTGIDFDSLREYAPDDDVRHIDWNVTARLDEPYVRQYTEDRDITAWLVLDQSASMRFGGTAHGKDSVLTDLAVCLARLFTQGGNRVGAVLYDNALQRVIPPRTGRTHVLHLTQVPERVWLGIWISDAIESKWPGTAHRTPAPCSPSSSKCPRTAPTTSNSTTTPTSYRSRSRVIPRPT